MEKQDSFNGFEFDANRATPHFSDARVIQAARPVVPLESQNRNGRKSRLVLTGAFAAAMLLGAAVALIAARLERQRFQSAAIEVSRVEANDPSVGVDKREPASTEKLEEVTQPAEPETTDTLKGADQPPPDSVESVSKTSKPITKSPQLPVTQPRHHDEALSNEPVVEPNAQPTEDNDGTAKAVMVDQWQERRLRRIERMDRRARRAAQSRDLMRIDEIFEGAPRHP